MRTLFETDRAWDMAEKIDVVYTLVDDAQPGYAELLARYTQKPRDRDPARARDTLETLRYSLRSIERFAPWVGHIHILTCRPQIPEWLNTDHPKVSVVHHDQVMPASALPTFNSLSIISHLHLIPRLTQRFIYFEDDILLVAPLKPEDLLNGAGFPMDYEERHRAPRLDDIRDPATASGWNLALAKSNLLLDERYGPPARHQTGRSPLLIDKARREETLGFFPEARDSTVHSRFSAAGNMAPEFLYSQCLLAEGKAQRVSYARAKYTAGYVQLEDVWPVTLWFLALAHLRKPTWLTFNDNFGSRPIRVTMAMVRMLLHHLFPEPSAFERPLRSADA